MKLFLGASSLLAICWSSSGLAQSLVGGDGAGNEIVVTAQRREQRLSDVGLSISVVGADALQTRNISSAADLANVVPSFQASNSGLGTPLYTLRGVGVNEPSLGVASSVAIYVDEIPLPFPVMTQGATLDTQRIEVLKGPQGTLYGQNSTGGAINYIANKPRDEFEAGATGSFGRFATGSLEGYVSGPLSSTLKARVALRTIQSGPWQKSYTRDDKMGNTNQFVGRATLIWEPSSRLRVSLVGSGWRDHSDTLAPQLIDVVPRSAAAALILTPAALNAPPAPPNARLADWTPDEEHLYKYHDYFYQGALRADWQLSDEVTLTSISAYAKMHRDAAFSQDGMAPKAQYFSQLGGVRAFNQEVRLSADFPGVHWIVGGNYQKAKSQEQLANFSPESGQNAVAGIRYDGAGIRQLQRIRSWAVFTNIDIPLVETLTLTGGIRLSEERRSTESCSNDKGDGRGSLAFTTLINQQRAARGLAPVSLIPPFGCISTNADLVPELFVGSFSESNVPWNIGLNWKPSSRLLVYGRVSRGFKSGNYAALPGANNAVYSPVRQERLTAYELGTRFRLGTIANVELALFKYQYIDKQQRGRIVVPIFGNVNAQLNIPKSNLKGIDASVLVRPIKDLTLQVSGVYIDSKIDQFVGTNVAGVTVNFAGDPLSFTPKYNLNADAEYRFALNDRIGAFAGAGLAYRSRTVAQLAAPFEFDIDAYTLLDARLGVEDVDGHWKAWIWGKNLTNKYYWTNAVRGGDVNIRYAGMPVTYGISVSYKY